VLPVFVLLVLGAIEFGRAYFTLHLMSFAARDGCRGATLPGSTESDVISRVNSTFEAFGMAEGCGEPVVTVTDPDGVERASLSDAQQGDSVEVTVTYDFEVLTGSVIPGFQGVRELHASCVFRHE